MLRKCPACLGFMRVERCKGSRKKAFRNGFGGMEMIKTGGVKWEGYGLNKGVERKLQMRRGFH